MVIWWPVASGLFIKLLQSGHLTDINVSELFWTQYILS